MGVLIRQEERRDDERSARPSNSESNPSWTRHRKQGGMGQPGGRGSDRHTARYIAVALSERNVAITGRIGWSVGGVLGRPSHADTRARRRELARLS